MALPAPSPIRLGVQGLTIESAIDHLVEAAQGLVENQIELARLDVEQAAGRIIRSAVFVALGVALLGGALVAVAMAGYAAMPDSYPPETRLGLLAAAAAGLGLVLTWVGVRRIGGHGGD